MFKPTLRGFCCGLGHTQSLYVKSKVSIIVVSGEAYFKLDQLEEAEMWYQRALKAKPDHIPAHLTMGKLLHRRVRTQCCHLLSLIVVVQRRLGFLCSMISKKIIDHSTVGISSMTLKYPLMARVLKWYPHKQCDYFSS